MKIEMTTKLMLLAGLAVGLLLLVIGASIPNRGTFYAGAFILPMSLFWGGLFLQEEGTPLRVAMMAIGGFLAAAVVGGISILSLY